MLGAAALSLLTGCQQQRPYPVFFLAENEGAEEGARFVFKHGTRHYTKQPIFALEHFEKFCSYLEPDGSYSVELFVKDEYRTRLEFLYEYNRGRLVLPMVNGHALSPLRLDRPIKDGSLVLWGVTGYDIKQIARTVKPINEEIEEKRFLDDDPRPKPKKPDVKEQSKDVFGRTIPEIFSSES